jgi:hypothetical protein
MSKEAILLELTSEFEAAGDRHPQFNFIAYDQASFGDAVISYSGALGSMRITRDRAVYLLDVETPTGVRPIEAISPAVAPLVAEQRPLREVLTIYRDSCI